MSDNRTIGIEPCCCGHRACSTYWLTGIGSFTQGSGFTHAEADELARRWNIAPRLEAAVRAIMAADQKYKEEISPAQAAGIEFHDPLEDALKSAVQLLRESRR